MNKNVIFLIIIFGASLLAAYQVYTKDCSGGACSSNGCYTNNMGQKECPRTRSVSHYEEDMAEECPTCVRPTPDAFRDEIYDSNGRSGHEAY